MFNEQYIAVANQRASDSNSIIYRYNVTSASFEVVQLITTNGATDWEHFTINWPQALSRGSQLLRPRIRISQHVFNTATRHTILKSNRNLQRMVQWVGNTFQLVPSTTWQWPTIAVPEQ